MFNILFMFAIWIVFWCIVPSNFWVHNSDLLYYMDKFSFCYFVFLQKGSTLMSLNGKTPSEACGITIQGDDKWKTLIQRASLWFFLQSMICYLLDYLGGFVDYYPCLPLDNAPPTAVPSPTKIMKREIYTSDCGLTFGIIKPGGKCIKCGWNSHLISDGFEITRILLVNHGSHHNDTIVTVQRKMNQSLDDIREA